MTAPPVRPLAVASFGPPTKGVVDAANPALDLTGACRTLRNAVYTGINRLAVRPGASAAMTLYDDQATPQPVTSVRAIVPFADGALAVGYSSATQKVYLYRLSATLDTWIGSDGATYTNPNVVYAMGVLWTGVTVAPDVLIAEGLGVAYLAHTGAADSSGLYWPTKTFTDSTRVIATLAASGTDGTSAGTDVAYFLGVISFQQALWGWGYGAGTTAANGYRPELLRFSPPLFGNLQTADSLTVGDRVRSVAERVLGAAVAGNALIVAASNLLVRITGYGRDSWYREPVDHSYGVVGPKALVTAGDTVYYWSRRGPMRITALGAPEPLWDALPTTVAGLVNPSRVVAAFDPDRDQVLFHYDTGTSTGNGARTWCAFDIRREVWVGPDNDHGVSIACAGTVLPYVASTANPPAGPAGPPTSPSTTSVGQTTATANWVCADTLSQTVVELDPNDGGTFPWSVTLAAGVTSTTFTGLTAGTPYQWRARHVYNGQYSVYMGPGAATQFTTTAASGGGSTLQPPTNLSVAANSPRASCTVTWTNSGETGVQTEVWRSSDGTTFGLVTTVASGIASTTNTVPSYGTWYYEVRHVTQTTQSAFCGPASATVSGNGGV